MLSLVKMKAKVLPKKCFGLLTSVFSSSRASLAFFICLLAVVFAYRIQLTISLFTNAVRPFDFNPAQHAVWLVLAYLPSDLAFVFVCFSLSWLLSRVASFIKQSKMFRILRISGLIFLHLVLLAAVLIHGIHGRLLFDVQTGFDSAVMKEAFSGISLIETLRLVGWRDYVFLLFPFGFFWLTLLFSLRLRIWIAGISLTLAILLLSLSLLMIDNKAEKVPDEIRLNPVVFLLSDMTKSTSFIHLKQGQTMSAVGGKGSGIQSFRPMETKPIERALSLPAKNNRPWNLIIFIMESAGARYIFDTSDGDAMPMPFLHKISQEGWYLKRHFTTSNVSTKAVFSILSGLYDFFSKETFGTRPDVEVPAVYNWLDQGYDRFLVTPSSISWYFPTKFVVNSGLSEIHSYENLNFKIKEEFHSLGHYIARDEVQTTDFFIQRLREAREPFLGIYISFAAHFPYFDYGEDYRIRKDDGHLISRYYNNLNLLDHGIKRIVDHLREQGLLEHTLLVIVGDHGQAFGQHHPNNFMHYRYSYNENLEAPAILYQPALFRPKTFGFPTSHVDLLPTLLDAMRIPYPSTAFDGRSLFSHRARQAPIFFYGYEESISSLDSHLIKVQYSLKKNKCWAFDLKLDPDEKNPLDCSSFPLEVEGLHKFVAEHDANLLKYNASLREKKGLQGAGVPILKAVSSPR
jgi:phosphoglycerol transferase MdoB-like AlkP superfamily enzyme